MSEEESYEINDTMRSIRLVANALRVWADNSPLADQRHVAIVLTKLEEAELLTQRIVKEDSSE